MAATFKPKINIKYGEKRREKKGRFQNPAKLHFYFLIYLFGKQNYRDRAGKGRVWEERRILHLLICWGQGRAKQKLETSNSPGSGRGPSTAAFPGTLAWTEAQDQQPGT